MAKNIKLKTKRVRGKMPLTHRTTVMVDNDEFGSCEFWPNSPASREASDKAIAELLKRAGATTLEERDQIHIDQWNNS